MSGVKEESVSLMKTMIAAAALAAATVIAAPAMAQDSPLGPEPMIAIW